ncbi:MAG: cation diffusion facilitator family transporter [Lachnospiraceae bacterium]|nr:cation diffusion facilitator family transporter [Lachnospiraceae bacterium]
MTGFLVKKFVKNNDDIGSNAVRTSYGVLAGITGICVNCILFVMKFIIGTITGAVSVTADAFNNLSDVASSLISLVGAKMAARPANADHPFGHGRLEYVSALAVAFLVLEVGFKLLKDSVSKILNPEPIQFSVVSVVVLVLSIMLKLWLSVFNTKLGKRINSQPMLATAADSRNDCLSTMATIVSLLVFSFLSINIDGIVGLLVSFLILKCGVEIAKDTLDPLIGGNVDIELSKTIKEFILSYPEVLGCHDLIVHNYGPSKSFASVHVEISDTTGLEASHILMDGIERDCLKKYGIQLVTHTDPIDVTNPKTIAARECVEKTVKDIGDGRVSTHDVRIVHASEGKFNVVFDLIVPYSYTQEQNRNLTEKIQEKLREIKPEYSVVITIEHSFAEADN